jgi:zinc D-Ala-D-Ala carboxypeptidase
MHLKIRPPLFSVYDMYDDIPEASRQPAKELSRATRSISDKRRSQLTILLTGGAAGVGLLGLLVIALLMQLQPSAQVPVTSASTSQPASASPAAAPASANSDTDTLLGHLPYAEAPERELVPISPDGQIRLRQAAAESYRRMAAAAVDAGVTLSPISGFRSKADQDSLFFRVKEERNQGVSKRAEVSAPPGHSEHHTGYAMDIGDGTQSGTNLSQSFENTAAFQWLSAHAAQYSFEMSFTRGNTQGVSYEPWHWRFVGDQDSLETFYRAQHLKPGSP